LWYRRVVHYERRRRRDWLDQSHSQTRGVSRLGTHILLALAMILTIMSMKSGLGSGPLCLLLALYALIVMFRALCMYITSLGQPIHSCSKSESGPSMSCGQTKRPVTACTLRRDHALLLKVPATGKVLIALHPHLSSTNSTQALGYYILTPCGEV
jgi:hypothetical protein